jgi:hypothetical protein
MYVELEDPPARCIVVPKSSKQGPTMQHGLNRRSWLARARHNWPGFAIAFGMLLTIGWITGLMWLLAHIVMG